MNRLDDWGVKLLEERRYAVLATQDDDGLPHLTPVWYLFRNEQLYIGSSSSSRKVRNVVARPAASLIVDVRRLGAERWIAASGSVTVLKGEDSRQMAKAILERYLTSEALNDPRVGPAFAATDDVILCLKPTKWRSWALADIDRQYFGGILQATPSRWFLPID
jgi:PPOX class probable F420-dependent enzyme